MERADARVEMQLLASQIKELRDEGARERRAIHAAIEQLRSDLQPTLAHADRRSYLRLSV